jgi:hypothetical protein
LKTDVTGRGPLQPSGCRPEAEPAAPPDEGRGENLDDPEGCGDLRYLVQGLALDLAHPRLPSVLALQVRERRYVPWTYWSTVVLVSVVGTQVTDRRSRRRSWRES